MIAWLTDTLVMTGALMGLILLVRRPVGRWFGPGAAYALWALPMIRLLLPPLALPEGLAIARATEAWSPPVVGDRAAGPAFYAYEAGGVTPADIGAAAEWSWTAILVAVWLTGAALFLLHRFVSYHVMRRELLRAARTIGHSGAVRIVESSTVTAPVAFGVFDRVVALPRGFLAAADSDASDFAITHELEHHAGNDLIANIALQPLFALHWFNPLAWLAWRALRSDQEAACDARVMAGRTRHERERYGRLIASFAASSRFALAAPMAGPLKGDKPIIHRLKALVRNDVPERHRLLGRSLFAVSVVAVPLTASVTYAAEEVQEAPLEPTASAQVAPRSEHGDPTTPPAPAADEQSSEESDGEWRATDVSQREQARHHSVTRRRTTTQVAIPHPISEAEIERMTEWTMVDGRRAEAEAARAEREAARAERRAEHEAARAEREAERQSRLALMHAPKVAESWSADGKVQTLRIVTPARSGQPGFTRTMVIDGNCPADQQHRTRAVANGAVGESRVCTGAPDTSRHVALALRRARASVVANDHIPSHVRGEILSDLDKEIAGAVHDRD